MEPLRLANRGYNLLIRATAVLSRSEQPKRVAESGTCLIVGLCLDSHLDHSSASGRTPYLTFTSVLSSYLSIHHEVAAWPLITRQLVKPHERATTATPDEAQYKLRKPPPPPCPSFSILYALRSAPLSEISGDRRSRLVKPSSFSLTETD